MADGQGGAETSRKKQQAKCGQERSVDADFLYFHSIDIMTEMDIDIDGQRGTKRKTVDDELVNRAPKRIKVEKFRTIAISHG